MSNTTPPPRAGGAGPAGGLKPRHGVWHHLRRFSALELAVALIVLVVIANLLLSLGRSGSTPDSPDRVSQAAVTNAPSVEPQPASSAIPSEEQTPQAETVSTLPASAAPDHSAVSD